ncbi:MAG: S8 family serine peptidase [Planctomycetaceae bacterium]
MLRRIDCSVLAVAGLLVWTTFACAPAWADDAAPQDEADVLIRYKTHPQNADHVHIQNHGGKVKHSYWIVPSIAARVPKAKLAKLKENLNVQSVEPDVVVHINDVELDNTWGVKRIGGGAAQIAGATGTGVKVAVIDTGIDYRHPDLDANYKGGWDFVNNDNDPLDDHGHGTHCAGTIAAEANATGVVGVAPHAQLYALKVLDANGSGYSSNIIAAVQWCIQNGIQVTSNSYGSSTDMGTSMKQAFDNAAAIGIVNVAAAGNSGTSAGTENTVGYPAQYASVIAVAATDGSDVRAYWSSTGPAVEIAAPGVSILSTLKGGGYGYMSGTSMACPHAAGAAAVLISAGLTHADDVRYALDMSALDLGVQGQDTWYGYGRIDLSTALSALTPPSPPPPPPPPPPSSNPPSTPTVATVDGVYYSLSGGKKNDKNLIVDVDIVDDFGDPVAGAVVTVQIRRGTKSVLSAQATTDVNGTAVFTINGAKGGTYTTTITNITASGLTWDHASPSNSFVKK